ncbi:3-coathanger stack domain-containing protein [Flavilitoribacter nigricans]|uniref:Uncharacterized protein n=1 Tax=Flavilitoribacter nigricans (strain ATCC 23147 / DSM 23189 / NBRC 102662 / NCIMB 1420 / SS-2) TaxID=1122177 RepID=A0A2D0NDG5_FLAN2|nr:3-coathanger stack domain-containing protein [Flavilitoribacter nigricans]PHN06448.1 hypothetical protein CRP01_12840 [Flavilitoribacter nigricans DSM 23189 = NBRC 102662]
MQYFEWIEKYKEGKLSAADRLAFEQEVEENGQLRAELEAVGLTESLLAAVAGSPDVAPSSPTTGRVNYQKIYTITIALILAAVAIFAWQYRSPELEQLEETIVPMPILPVPDDSESIPKTLAPKEDDHKNVKRPVAAADIVPKEPVKENNQAISRPISAPQQATPKLAEATVKENPIEIQDPASKEISTAPAQEKIAVYTVSAVIDTALAQASDIALTATEKIVLKPGFHAKAGTTFKARVNNGPLFEKKGAPN